jgi:hypothetical protein
VGASVVSSSNRCLVTAPAATAAAATITASTATSTGARFAWFGFVDRQGATLKLGTVQDLNRAFSSVAHLDEPKASRATGFSVHRDLGSAYRAVVREQGLQILGRGAERKIPNIDIHQVILCDHMRPLQSALIFNEESE